MVKCFLENANICIIIHWLAHLSVPGNRTDDGIRKWCSNMLSTQARRDRSHGLVPRKRLSEHLQLDTFHLRPITAENLLITAYMPAELAQIDFGKKLIEIFKKSEKPFSIRKKKHHFLRLNPTFRLKSISSLLKTLSLYKYLFPYEQAMAFLGQLHKPPIRRLDLQGSDTGFMSDYLGYRPVKRILSLDDTPQRRGSRIMTSDRDTGSRF